LSFTGSPTWKPPVVALAFAPAAVAESAELDGAGPDVRGVDAVSPDADEPVELVDELIGAAIAAPALAKTRPAAARRRKVERMGVSLFNGPRPSPKSFEADIVPQRRKTSAKIGGRCGYIAPSVFNLARGWISFWLSTTVWPRNRSTIERM